MKKALGAIAATLGFLGLASFILFFVMSPDQTFLSGTSLTADISANFFGNSSAPAPTGDGQATDANTANTPSAPTATSTDNSQINAPTPSASVPILATDTIATSTITPEAAFEILDNNNAVTSTDLPAATATITVTPTVPPPPISLLQTTQNVSGDTSQLPYSEFNFTGDTDWESTWGILNITNSGYLQLSAGANSFGGAVYLKNGARWENYSMNATLDPIAGKTFGLMANYVDASNYVLCEYTVTSGDTATMQLAQYVKGYKIILFPSVLAAWNGYGTDINASIEISGVYSTCSFQNETISNEGIGAGKSAMSSPGSGTVGITINDSSPNVGQVIVKSVTVNAK